VTVDVRTLVVPEGGDLPPEEETPAAEPAAEEPGPAVEAVEELPEPPAGETEPTQ
jgi:hypothetical protein